MERQHRGMDWPGVRQGPEGSGEQGKMEKTGCKIICGARTTLAVKELMMMVMTPNLQFSSVQTSSLLRYWQGQKRRGAVIGTENAMEVERGLGVGGGGNAALNALLLPPE